MLAHKVGASPGLALDEFHLLLATTGVLDIAPGAHVCQMHELGWFGWFELKG